MNKRQYFGTDGIRGRVGDKAINPEFMLKLGWAVGKVFSKKDKPILIGYDTRVSCQMLQSALQAGILSAGIDVRLIGCLPTPAVAYLTQALKAAAGVVISASHNSYEDNGIKFFNEKGMKLDDQLELKIEEKTQQWSNTAAIKKIGRLSYVADAKERYIDFCKKVFPTKLNLQPLRIVLDCANGATFEVAPPIFAALGAEVMVIANTPDGININKHCGATDLKALQQAVRGQKADVGIAFDGDGDRLMMVDHEGKVIDGDQILCILAKDRFIEAGNRGGVVGTLMSNLGLEQALHADGIAFKRAKVGDRYVLEELQNSGWALGGEASGHILNLDCTTTGDGIITGLQVLAVMQKHQRRLNELTAAMIKCPQMLINIPTKSKVDLDLFPKLQDAARSTEASLAGGGRVLLRPSGTESMVRVMVEGHDKKVVRLAAQNLADIVKKVIGI